MELRHLRYFVAVAEELNFRRAADRLRVAQPPLSAQIKALESELGVRLFDRTTRQVKLTGAGRVFLDEARAVLDSAVRAERRAREAQQGITGTIRVGVVSPATNGRLAQSLSAFRRHYPNVQLAVFDITSAEQMQRLRRNELDVGVLRPPVPFADLEFEFFEQLGYMLAAPTQHRLARKRTLEWKDFDGEDLVMIHPSIQHGFYDSFLAACSKAGAKPVAAQYAHDIQTKMWLISAGFGIGPTVSTVAEVQRPGLMFRPLPPGLPPADTVLTWRKNDDSLVLRRFRQALLHGLPKAPPK